MQCPVPPVPSDGVLALHSGHVGWARGVSLSLMALPDSPSPPERDEAASTNHGGASPLEQVTFQTGKQEKPPGCWKSHRDVSPTSWDRNMALTHSSACESLEPAWHSQNIPEEPFWKLWMSWPVLGFGSNRNEDAQGTESPGMGWVSLLVVPPSAPPAAPSLHTQTPVQVSCAGKCRGVCPSGGFSAWTGAGSEDETGESGAEGVHQVSI